MTTAPQVPAMKIYVSRIPPDGLQEETTYDPKAMDLERFDVHPEDPIIVSSAITKADRELVVQADIRGSLQLSCGRCLAAFTLPLHAAATLSYEVAPTDVVDTTEDIRQEILLAYPMVPVCRDDCKGLCLSCGKNLNQGVCGCATSNP